MTDLLPNGEVKLSSDLFDDDPCLESMSAQATAVLDAYMTGYGWLDSPTKKDCRGVAAALRTAADQVVPWRPEPTEDSVGPTIDYGYAWALFSKANDIRQELIAIADELEAQ
jgi:hypothetical protein